MKAPKTYKIKVTKSPMFHGQDRHYFYEGTLDELIQKFSYTLKVGRSYQHETGNKKINCQPKSIKSLLTNLYNAENNAASNGYSGFSFELVA